MGTKHLPCQISSSNQTNFNHLPPTLGFSSKITTSPPLMESLFQTPPLLLTFIATLIIFFGKSDLYLISAIGHLYGLKLLEAVWHLIQTHLYGGVFWFIILHICRLISRFVSFNWISGLNYFEFHRFFAPSCYKYDRWIFLPSLVLEDDRNPILLLLGALESFSKDSSVFQPIYFQKFKAGSLPCGILLRFDCLLLFYFFSGFLEFESSGRRRTDGDQWWDSHPIRSIYRRVQSGMKEMQVCSLSAPRRHSYYSRYILYIFLLFQTSWSTNRTTHVNQYNYFYLCSNTFDFFEWDANLAQDSACRCCKVVHATLFLVIACPKKSHSRFFRRTFLKSCKFWPTPPCERYSPKSSLVQLVGCPFWWLAYTFQWDAPLSFLLTYGPPCYFKGFYILLICSIVEFCNRSSHPPPLEQSDYARHQTIPTMPLIWCSIGSILLSQATVLGCSKLGLIVFNLTILLKLHMATYPAADELVKQSDCIQWNCLAAALFIEPLVLPEEHKFFTSELLASESLMLTCRTYAHYHEPWVHINSGACDGFWLTIESELVASWRVYSGSRNLYPRISDRMGSSFETMVPIYSHSLPVQVLGFSSSFKKMECIFIWLKGLYNFLLFNWLFNSNSIMFNLKLRFYDWIWVCFTFPVMTLAAADLGFFIVMKLENKTNVDTIETRRLVMSKSDIDDPDNQVATIMLLPMTAPKLGNEVAGSFFGVISREEEFLLAERCTLSVYVKVIFSVPGSNSTICISFYCFSYILFCSGLNVMNILVSLVVARDIDYLAFTQAATVDTALFAAAKAKMILDFHGILFTALFVNLKIISIVILF